MERLPFRPFFFVLTFGLSSLTSSAFYIRLHGSVTEHFTGEAMKGVQIRLVKDSVDRETVITTGNGKYELYLERGYNYQIWFYRPDLVTKHVLIDARDVPLFPDVPFYDMDLQMTMFTWIDNMGFDLFITPVGKAEYKHSVRNLNWDIAYTQKVSPKVDRFMILYQRELAVRDRKQYSKSALSKQGRRKRVDF